MKTAQIQAQILARHNAESIGNGGIVQFVSGEVVGTPTGRTWGHNPNPGPLDGQPEMRYTYNARYSDGSIRVYR